MHPSSTSGCRCSPKSTADHLPRRRTCQPSFPRVPVLCCRICMEHSGWFCFTPQDAAVVHLTESLRSVLARPPSFSGRARRATPDACLVLNWPDSGFGLPPQEACMRRRPVMCSINKAGSNKNQSVKQGCVDNGRAGPGMMQAVKPIDAGN